MSVDVTISGFDELIQELKSAPEELSARVAERARPLAEGIAGAARLGAPVREGRLRNSIESFVEQEGTSIRGGARTSYPPAIYHEFGTGPVGSAHPHPADGALGIKRRPDGWVYWSEGAAENRPPDKDGNPDGWVYTKGVPAKAFMYNAMTAYEKRIADELGAAVEEVFK